MSSEVDECGSEDTIEEIACIVDRPEWSDVVPEASSESEVPVVAIDFEPEYRDIYGLLRAMIKADEKSQRALWISAEAIKLSSANYGAWDWHWRCWEACGHQPGPELRLMQEIAADNPKNYQLWNFRRRFALHRGPANAQEEMDFAADCLRVDAKNYHAWGHRHAMLQAFGLWRSELKLTSLLLEDDPFNNSAWSQRHVAFSMALSSKDADVTVAHEAAWTRDQILRAVRNQASWNYLRSLCACLAAESEPWSGPQFRAKLCNQVLAKDASCAPAWSLLVHLTFCASYIRDQSAKQHQSLLPAPVKNATAHLLR
ncbi:hypothetical protein WJX74_007924 [Apatococcus lobatus]|uniref:Protein farnesyltransferase/geranylgeranyltransferase type-1 subunit alpha n=1 Tax=Apatococcus lobatus TaxID=904363 RepID=A0AAW1RH38_9CHLO